MTKKLGITFSGEGQGKIHHVVVSEEKSNTTAEERSIDKWEGYTKWEGWKCTKNCMIWKR